MSHTRIVPTYTLVRPDGTPVATVAEHADNSDEILVDTQEALTAQESELLIEAIRRLKPKEVVLPNLDGQLQVSCKPLVSEGQDYLDPSRVRTIDPTTGAPFTFTRDGE